MRLQTNTPERLVVVDRPWLFFLLFAFVGVICASGAVRALGGETPGMAVPMLVGLGCCLFMIAYFIRPMRLEADVAAGTVEVRQFALGRRRQVVLPLEAVEKAGVQGRAEHRHGPRPLWLAMYLERGDQPGWQAVTAPSRLGGEARAAQYFNAWLKSHRARETLRG